MSIQEEQVPTPLGVASPVTPSGRQIDVLFGAYADVLFVILPYLVVALFRFWFLDLKSILYSSDLSIAAAVLGGLSIVKFILGLVIHPEMVNHREKLVFLLAGTVIGVLVPSLLMTVFIMWSNPVPDFVMLVQPMLLILGIMSYTGAVATTNALLERRNERLL